MRLVADPVAVFRLVAQEHESKVLLRVQSQHQVQATALVRVSAVLSRWLDTFSLFAYWPTRDDSTYIAKYIATHGLLREPRGRMDYQSGYSRTTSDTFRILVLIDQCEV